MAMLNNQMVDKGNALRLLLTCCQELPFGAAGGWFLCGAGGIHNHHVLHLHIKHGYDPNQLQYICHIFQFHHLKHYQHRFNPHGYHHHRPPCHFLNDNHLQFNQQNGHEQHQHQHNIKLSNRQLNHHIHCHWDK